MKKVSLLFTFIVLFFSSCEKDESLDPRPDLVAGQYIRLNVISNSIDFNNISNSAFVGEISDPSKTIAKYELFIRRRNANGINTSDFVLFKTITSFPHQLNVTAQDIATVLDINVSDLQDGDIYRFIGFSYDSNGNKVGYLNLSRTVQSTPSMKQGYRFSTNLSSTIDPDNPFNNYAPFGV
jgi:hypothetical protein